MFPEKLARITKLEGANLGVALDGDADRVIFCDEKGEIIHGDQIIAVLAREMQKNNELNNNRVVGTLMSNLGLEKYLKKLNINLHRTNVGDRYILDEMIKTHCKLGGEPSGHILLTDYAKTGDGLLTAIKIFSGTFILTVNCFHNSYTDNEVAMLRSSASVSIKSLMLAKYLTCIFMS